MRLSPDLSEAQQGQLRVIVPRNGSWSCPRATWPAWWCSRSAMLSGIVAPIERPTRRKVSLRTLASFSPWYVASVIP
jgi:hypothetical protein